MDHNNPTLKVAALQMDIALGERRKNMVRAEAMLAQAADEGAAAVLLPELWTTGYALTRIAELSEPPGSGEALDCMRELAARHRLYIGGGSIPEREADGRVYNTSYIIGPDGALLARYRKRHLFPLMDEHIYLAPGGAEMGLANTEYGKWGTFICFDLRFPEIARELAVAGARILWVPAEWPHPRLEHWRTLLIARAIEDQCFVVACNRVGRDDNSVFFGHSLIIDPWGRVLAEGGEDEQIVTATLELGEVDAVRKRIPCFEVSADEV